MTLIVVTQLRVRNIFPACRRINRTDLLLSIRLSPSIVIGITIGAVLLALLVFSIIFRRLWPSVFKNTFRLKGRSNQNQLVTESFEYRPIVNESASSHGLTPTHAYGLTTQASQASFNPTPPSTGLLPISGGGSYNRSAYADTLVPGPNV